MGYVTYVELFMDLKPRIYEVCKYRKYFDLSFNHHHIQSIMPIGFPKAEE